MTTTTATRAPAPTGRAAGGNALTGTGTLVRFILRRDRIRLPVWIGAIVFFTVVSVASLPGLYADASDRQARAELMRNPGLRAFAGPGYGLDDYTFGAMLAHEFLSWTAIFVGLMSILLMVRHTRAEEEAGRAELVRATVVGRHAQTTAALIVVGGANVVLGALLALGLGSLGLDDVDWASSWLFGAGLASIGLVFAAVTAVTAQVNEHARGAGGLAGAALAVAYLLRAAGDMSKTGGGALSWLSPIGWAQQTRVYVDNRWWPLLLSATLTALLTAVALGLGARRDIGAGMIQTRSGRATASALLSSPLGLAWRLHRTSTMWWSVVLLLFGLGYGALASEVERFVAELAALDEWLATIGGSVIDSFLSAIMMLLAVTASIFAVLTTLRLRGEEIPGRAEVVLATAVSRTRWAASHITVALVGSAALLLLSSLGLGLTAAAALDDERLLPRLLGAALAYVPAVWTTVGLGVALFGLVPRAVALVWVVIAYAGVIGSYAGILGLPSWTVKLTPFGHVPLLPAEKLTWTPLVVLTVLAAALIAGGLAAFRRRNIESV